MKHLTKPIRAIHFMVLAFLIALSSPVVAQDFRKGLEAYVAEDYVSAFNIWMPLAKAGKAKAQRSIGVLYEDGKGVSKDSEAAMAWYLLAASQDDSDASFMMGTMYHFGSGIPINYVLGHMWYNISRANGAKWVQEYIDTISEKMSLEAIEKAQQMATICMRSKYKKCGY